MRPLSSTSGLNDELHAEILELDADPAVVLRHRNREAAAGQELRFLSRQRRQRRLRQDLGEAARSG